MSDTELVRDLQEGLADARAGRVFSAGQVVADLVGRRIADEPGPPPVEGDYVIAGAAVPPQRNMIIAYKLGATGKHPDTVGG